MNTTDLIILVGALIFAVLIGMALAYGVYKIKDWIVKKSLAKNIAKQKQKFYVGSKEVDLQKQIEEAQKKK